MSKPPSKSSGGRSGGSGRGRPPRDRSSFVDAPRRGASRDGSPRDGASREGAFRDGERRGGRSRGGERDDAPRSGGSRYNSGGPRSASSRDGGPRGDSQRGYGPRDGAPRSSRRDEAPRGERRDGPARSSYSQGDAPRGGARSGPRDGTLRDAPPRATYSRGPAREDRFGGPRGERRDDERRYERGTGSRARSDAPRGPRPIARPGPAPKAAKPTPKDPTLPAREGDRIAKLLARAGVASRREVERLIIEGRVKLNDVVVETPSTVLTSLRGVTVDDNPIAEPEGTRLFVFHKPSGLLTAERDPTGRPTIYTALRNALPEGSGRVMPIGRLDLNTEGLLLLTNDGAFKRALELPATGVPRTYRARTFGDITQARLEELMEGIEIDGVIYGRIDANMERRTGRNQWIEMTLTEGKNREVRRVLEALGLQVSRLIRVSYGPFILGDLPKGAAYEVTARELDNFSRTLPSLAAKEQKAEERNAAEHKSGEPEA